MSESFLCEPVATLRIEGGVVGSVAPVEIVGLLLADEGASACVVFLVEGTGESKATSASLFSSAVAGAVAGLDEVSFTLRPGDGDARVLFSSQKDFLPTPHLLLREREKDLEKRNSHRPMDSCQQEKDKSSLHSFEARELAPLRSFFP